MFNDEGDDVAVVLMASVIGIISVVTISGVLSFPVVTALPFPASVTREEENNKAVDVAVIEDEDMDCVA